jgi:exosome complex RNA-binding protein Csl4
MADIILHAFLFSSETLNDYFDIGDPVRAVVIKVDHEAQIVV